jgi:Animal haem peroxidase
MLFTLGHGQHVIEDLPAAQQGIAAATAEAAAIDAEPLAAVAPGVEAEAEARAMEMAGAAAIAGDTIRAEDAEMVNADRPARAFGKFRYYFPNADGLPEDPKMPEWLDKLADSMVEAPRDPGTEDSKIPAIFTYLGQFIDHDITANTDRDTEISIIDGPIKPLERKEVKAKLVNLRDGSLGLDSLYGDGEGQGAFSQKLAQLMRFPGNQAKMRLALPAEIGGRVPLPATDNATDLLRLGFLLRNGLLTEAELKALTPPALRDVFIDRATDTPIITRAIIGDARNDENLLVAQLQVLFLRLHNKLADATGGRSFRKARRLTRYHYQWLVVNSYLPTICDPAIVEEVLDMEAPLYSGFFDKHGSRGPKMPMPLEFSVAVYRFGHSMVRAAYDHNRVFGEEVTGFEHLSNFSPFSLLFAFTGDGGMPPSPVPTDPPNTTGQLPQRWVIEWERFVKTDPTRPRRSARKIDTQLAPPLDDLSNAPAGVFKHLARRNLRRGYRLNLPTAQACIAAIQKTGCKQFPVLTPEQIREGSTLRQEAVDQGGFATKTPLWFYVLKEAEVLGQGQHLGPLGSHIVANTLAGLIINDSESYWNAEGGRWSPKQFRPSNPIDSLEDLVAFCGML